MGFLGWLVSRENGGESGAVTVDWVVLTAAIVTIGAAVIAIVSPGLSDATDQIYTGIVDAGNE